MAICAPQILQFYPQRKQNVITSFFFIVWIWFWYGRELNPHFPSLSVWMYMLWRLEYHLRSQSLLLLGLSETGSLVASCPWAVYWAVFCVGLPSSIEALGWSYHDWLIRAIWRCKLHPHVRVYSKCFTHWAVSSVGNTIYLGFKAWLKCILFQKVSLTAFFF